MWLARSIVHLSMCELLILKTIILLPFLYIIPTYICSVHVKIIILHTDIDWNIYYDIKTVLCTNR